MVKNKKQKRYLDEIFELQATRRRDLLLMAGSVLLIIIVILVKNYLDAQGILDPSNAIYSGLVWLVAFGLAIVAGFAGRDFSKSGRRIQELCDLSGMTLKEIKANNTR